MKVLVLGPIEVIDEGDARRLGAQAGRLLGHDWFVTGTVISLAPASGSQFSLLPPQNATGNFTKIVQRVPVRIAVSAKDADGRLRPGLSVVVDIDTRTVTKAAEQVVRK